MGVAMSKIAFQRAFQEFTEDEIAEVMERTDRVFYPEGTRILREGETNGRIFIILEGSARVVRYAKGGQEEQIAQPLGPGDTFGEMSFIDDMGASATLFANNDMVVKTMDRQLVEEMAAKRSGFKERLYLSLLLTVIRRLRRVDAARLFDTLSPQGSEPRHTGQSAERAHDRAEKP